MLAASAAIVFLFPRPLAHAFFAAWVLFAVVLAVVGSAAIGIGGWMVWTPVPLGRILVSNRTG